MVLVVLMERDGIDPLAKQQVMSQPSELAGVSVIRID